jgi:adenosylhomocysteine nucleosidase
MEAMLHDAPLALSADRPLAILSALVEEQRGLIDHLQDRQQVVHAGRSFWLGRLEGLPVVLTVSRIGKVSAAITTTVLAERFGVGALVFTGVAGGLGRGVKVGDVVVAEDFIQHDLDASPLCPRYEVPAYGRARFACHAGLSQALAQATDEALSEGFAQASLHRGLVASGDRFVCGAEESRQLQERLRSAGHEALAVEMEGAAVAQACADHGLPMAAMRTISDRADDDAHQDFAQFVEAVASRYADQVMRRLVRQLARQGAGAAA